MCRLRYSTSKNIGIGVLSTSYERLQQAKDAGATAELVAQVALSGLLQLPALQPAALAYAEAMEVDDNDDVGDVDMAASEEAGEARSAARSQSSNKRTAEHEA